MLMPVSRCRGFTMIELMISLAILAILLVLAAPAYTIWIADSQIKAGVESVADGLRFAQGEALKQNLQVEFVLDMTTPPGRWDVNEVGGATLRSGAFTEGADKVTIAATPNAGTKNAVTFNGIGEIVKPNPAGGSVAGKDPFRRIDVSSVVGDTHPLRVAVGSTAIGASPGRRIKICDPAAAAQFGAGDPKACPADN